MLSVDYNLRIIIVVNIDSFIGVESCSKLFKSALWLEREIWDLLVFFFLIIMIYVEY